MAVAHLIADLAAAFTAEDAVQKPARKRIFNRGRLPFKAKHQSNARGLIKKLVLASPLLWTLPANALTITDDRGGLIPMYVAKMQKAAAMGERVIIDGNCLSACTMTLGIIPPENVCATSRAVLGFHSAFTPTPWGKRDYPPGTMQMVSHYPPAIREWIKRHGGLHPNLIYLRAPEIFQYVRQCQ
jgi:hypothetical protein